MGKRLLLGIIILLILNTLTYSQTNITPPIKGALNLSGAFGEIRTDHLHTGIDFRTGGKIGLKVYSIEKGYISRIKISPTGYGKAVYIDHPNGSTSVYAHLDMLAEPFASFVRDYQYNKKSFAVDIIVPHNKLTVSRGQLIAWSGNSGSSGGPHLHFEVRNSNTQHSLNPKFLGFSIVDNTKPEIRTVAIYRADSTTLINGVAQNQIVDVNSSAVSNLSDTIFASGTIGFGLEAYDWLSAQSTRTGINAALYTINGDTIFQYKADSLSFSEGRYVNSLTDYGLRQKTGKRVVKLFIDPNNKLMGYYVSPKSKQGYLTVAPDSVYNVKLIAADASGLSSSMDVTIKGVRQPKGPALPPSIPQNNSFILYNKGLSISTDSVKISIPQNALYTNIYFSHERIKSDTNSLSATYRVGSSNVPLHLPISIEIPITSNITSRPERTCLARVEKDGKLSYIGGSNNNNWVKASLRSFGVYTVAMDTIPPTITPLKRNGNGIIKFRIKDNFSGIASVNGYIDGVWALFEYDPKNELLLYRLDKERVAPSPSHAIKIIAEDNLGNTSIYESTFSF